MTNVINNNNVIIKATKSSELSNWSGFNYEIHRAMCKKALRNTLYAWAPIYRMVTVAGMTEGKLDYRIDNVIGGNSPVARAIVEKQASESNMTVVSIDDSGKEIVRHIVTGSDTANNGIRYDYDHNTVLLRFKDNNVSEDPISDTIVKRIVAEGLTIQDNDIVIGRASSGQYINACIWTPSNERNGQILFSSLDHNVIWNKLEAIGGNAITKQLKKGEMPVQKFKKLASRLGLFASPAIEFAKIGEGADFGILVLNKELLGSDDFNEEAKAILNEIGVEIDANQFDGAGYCSSRFMLEGFRNIGMSRMDAKKALLMAAQMRVSHVYAKIFAEAVHETVINKLVNYISSKFVEGKDYKVYGNSKAIGMILDSNAAKLADISREVNEPFTVYLLDIAKGSNSGTSTQMIEKFAIKDKEATSKRLTEIAKKEAEDFIASIGDNASSLLDDKMSPWEKLISIAKSAPADHKVVFDVFSDQYIITQILKEVNKKHTSAYQKCRVNIDSTFQRALFDITYLLSDGKIDGLLGIDSRGAVECYSTDILEENEAAIAEIEGSDTLTDVEKKAALDELLTGTIVKYPTPGSEEIELVRMLTKNEIKARAMHYVRNGVIDMDTARLIANYFAFTSYGTIKIAADNALKNKLAGMDTDYDGVVVILDKELNKIIEREYLARKNDLEETSGLIATHGGLVPFISTAK